MFQYLEQISTLLAIATILGQVFIVVGILALIFAKKNKLVLLAGKYGLLGAFIVSLTGSLLSLFYSDILHFAPCTLCWYQRIALYPQAILSVIALKVKDRTIIVYNSVLSVIGLFWALYHHYIQVGGVSILPCAANGVSCSVRFIFEFGYITMPLMGATAFGMILVCMAVYRNYLNTQKI